MCICCCSFHLESITSLQPGSALHRGVCSIKSAAHLNALDSISVEISPVCPGQSIKGPLKKKKKEKRKVECPGCPRIHLAQAESHTIKQSGKQLVPRRMWVKNTDWVAARPLTRVRFNHRLMGNKTGVLYNNCRHWRFHEWRVYRPHSYVNTDRESQSSHRPTSSPHTKQLIPKSKPPQRERDPCKHLWSRLCHPLVLASLSALSLSLSLSVFLCRCQSPAGWPGFRVPQGASRCYSLTCWRPVSLLHGPASARRAEPLRSGPLGSASGGKKRADGQDLLAWRERYIEV